MADASKAGLKVSLTVEEKKGGPPKSSLALPIQNEKIRSGSVVKEGVRKGSGDGARASDNSSGHSDSDRQKATGDVDLFALATSTSRQMSHSTSTDSFREILQPRRRSTELLNKARIGNYDYERAVQGLMGKYTYFGYRIDTNAKVTIKIIEKKNPALEALRIEYTLLRNISHPHVLQVYDILEDDQNVYFVMEYASRGRLIYEIGGSGPMQEREIKALMQQIVSAVVHNYELRHAVFREMELDYFTYFRPENVFLDQDGNIKIGAYGSIDMRKPSRTWFKQHTYPSFAAPEILRGKTSLLGLDSWSVGVLLFVLAKANFPFSGETVDDVLKSMATAPKLDLGSEEMRNLCNVLLQANTFSRLPLMEVMRHPWWSSAAVAAPELVRQNSRKESDEKGKKGKSLFGISFGKDSKDKK